MVPVIPRSITVIVSTASLAVAVAVWGIVSAGAGRSGLAPEARRAVRAGAALFLGAWVGLAFALAPPPASLLGRVPPAAAMGVFPMILVPAFAVPLSVLLHLTALARLRREVGVRSGLVPRAAA